MVALTGVEPADRQFSSVQLGLSGCRFSTVGVPGYSGIPPRSADVTAQPRVGGGTRPARFGDCPPNYPMPTTGALSCVAPISIMLGDFRRVVTGPAVLPANQPPAAATACVGLPRSTPEPARPVAVVRQWLLRTTFRAWRDIILNQHVSGNCGQCRTELTASPLVQ